MSTSRTTKIPTIAKVRIIAIASRRRPLVALFTGLPFLVILDA
jgi:hypothetical protein